MYVDAFHDRRKETILVAERDHGKRLIKKFEANYYFYYTDDDGRKRSLFGDPVCESKHFDSRGEMENEVARLRAEGRTIFESDQNIVFRLLEKRYRTAETPTLNVCFFDIETGFDAVRGFAPTDDPFNPVTAITLYLSHTKTLHTLALLPPTLSGEQGIEIGDKYDHTEVYDDEKALLERFLDLIEDVDVWSGWNSEGFDVPYLVNRTKHQLGAEAMRRFCLWGQTPREREYTKFGKLFKTYETVGRVHLDYLLLYQKHNTQQQHSYRLDFIGEIEVGEHKTPYDGTLDDLYKKDFERFLAYSRQDVMLLVKIDQKRKFIDLANQIAHGNCVLLKTTMGSVALVETAITNEMHDMGVVVPDRRPEVEAERDEDGTVIEVERTPVVGAYVAQPKYGLRAEIGCVDLNSLYPSTLRALNMSPETLYGQIRSTATMKLVQDRIDAGTPRAEAWEGLFSTLEVSWLRERRADLVTVDFEDGNTETLPAADLADMLFAEGSQFCVTANGTIFRTDVDGIIPRLLAKWYSERKDMQKKSAVFGDLASGIEIDASLAALLEQ